MQDRERSDALAAARLADAPQDLADARLPGDPVDRAHGTGAGEEMGPQIDNLEQRRRRGCAVLAARVFDRIYIIQR
jgi:hypothetical protein